MFTLVSVLVLALALTGALSLSSLPNLIGGRVTGEPTSLLGAELAGKLAEAGRPPCKAEAAEAAEAAETAEAGVGPEASEWTGEGWG